MDTKERNREKKAPAGQRKPTRSAAPTAKPPQQPKAKRPPAQAEVDYEVYVPDAESQQVRHSSENDGAPSGTRRAPAQRRAAPAKSLSKAPARNKETQYRPYRQANQRKKAQKKKSFRESASRFFSYQNPIVRKFYKEDPAVFGEDASAARREKRAAEAEKKRKRAQQLKTPAVIYTQPVTFNSRRLAIQLTTILAVVLALVLGMSVFFKVEVISVVGANVYSEWTIREQSGINEGDNLLTFGRTKASGQIIANLPYVKSARIGIKLPDTVIIEI